MSSSSSSSPPAVGRVRRTKLMIAKENRQILDYLCKGMTHEQIRRFVGLNEKNYWHRIAMIRKHDLEITKSEQTPEAHAFLLRRTEEKLQNLEVKTMQIIESKSVSPRDRLEAMSFLRRIYQDLLSIFLFGPSRYVLREASSSKASVNAANNKTSRPPSPFELESTRWDIKDDIINDDNGENDGQSDDKGDPNRVF